MLGFPQFADQFDNIIRMVAAGTTLPLPQEPLQPETFRSTIVRVLEEPRYVLWGGRYFACYRGVLDVGVGCGCWVWVLGVEWNYGGWL